MGTVAKMEIGDIFKTAHFGSVEVVSKVKNRKVLVRFLDTGHEILSYTDNVRTGKIKDATSPSIHGVGFVGEGKYKPTKNRTMNKSYSVWIGMINRCYNQNCNAYELYGLKGVKVHPDWHNFQNFAKWYEENHPNDGKRYELDKDIKVDGNKIYGPETCIFATPKANQNKAHLKTHHFISPVGVEVTTNNLPEFCDQNKLCKFNMAKLSRGVLKSHKKWTSNKLCEGGANKN